MTTIVMAADKIGLGSFAAWLKRLAENYSRYKMYRNTVDELQRLSDAELRDIGISRGMIHSVAKEIYFDKRGWV